MGCAREAYYSNDDLSSNEDSKKGSNMTLFREWCTFHGYKEDGYFEVLFEGCSAKKDARYSISDDDGTGEPYFDNAFESNVIIPLHYLKGEPVESVPEVIDNKFPAFNFKLSCGDKPEVRQWLKDNGCKWRGGTPADEMFLDAQYIDVQVLLGCSNVITKNAHLGIHVDSSYPELTLDIAPARVVGYKPLENSSKKDRLETLEQEVNKLQKMLQELRNE